MSGVEPLEQAVELAAEGLHLLEVLVEVPDHALAPERPDPDLAPVRPGEHWAGGAVAGGADDARHERGREVAGNAPGPQRPADHDPVGPEPEPGPADLAGEVEVG